MNNALAVLVVLALSVGLIGNAYAHKDQVVGNYRIEAGWAKAPPVVGKSNSIEVIVTTASMSDKAASDKMMKEMKGMTDEQMANMDHSKMSGSSTTKASTAKKPTTASQGMSTMANPGTKATGMTGLKLDTDITVNGKKTMLKLVEDKKTKGKYSAAFTPMDEGYPTIHIAGKIKNTPVEISFHPEKIEKSVKK
ncbi:MAG: hypothetical protein EPO62_02885 [Candidatus Nitrosotenuis sp.]|nr:MAG: hypothetical protein EPO62_02885 [Candidatus Nitrosotenuis sp.]